MTVQSMPLPWTAHPLDHPFPGSPLRWTALSLDRPKFRSFFTLLPNISLLFSLFWSLFVEFGFGFCRMHVWLSGLSCETLEARTRWPREFQICILQGPGASNTINIPRGESKRGKTSEIVERERKTKLEFLDQPPIWAPHPSCPGGWTCVVPRRSLTLSHVTESNHCKLMISSSRRRASSRPNMAGSSSAGAAVKF